MSRPLSSGQTRALTDHEAYRDVGYRTVPIRLVLFRDSRGQPKKRPHFFRGSWPAAESGDLEQAVRAGFTDIALVCDNIATLDFDPRPGETNAEVLERCRAAWKMFGLRGGVVERSGHGYHIILRAPAGEWSRRIHGHPHPVCEARCGRDTAGSGLLLFVAHSWHPVELRYYERLTPLVPVSALPVCPRELLEQPIKKLSTPTRQPYRETARGNGAGDWKTLDVVALFKNAGMYLGEMRASSRGTSARHSVRCPWESAHTSGSDGTDTIVFEMTATYGPLFKCLHAHCADRTMRDVREFFGADVVDRCCSREFKPLSQRTA